MIADIDSLKKGRFTEPYSAHEPCKQFHPSMAELLSFGYSKHGQLGREGVLARECLPAPISLPAPITAISSGGAFSSAVVHGDVFTWGDFRGAEPTKLADFREPMKQIISGSVYSIGLDTVGDVYIWGVLNNEHGRYLLYPRKFFGDFTQKPKIVSMASGSLFALFVDSHGSVYAFGENEKGECGLPDRITEEPKLIPFFTENKIKITAVACGGRHSLALTDQGQVYAWGENQHGQLGTANQENSATPILVDFPAKAAYIAAGDYHSLVVSTSGKLYTCGKNKQGQLGIGAATARESTFTLVPELDDVISCAAGGGLSCAHSFAVLKNGSLFSWGSGASGQLGYQLEGSSEFQLTPKSVDLGGKEVEAVSCGWLHTLVLTKPSKPVAQAPIIPRAQEGLGGLDKLPTDLILMILRDLNTEDTSRLGICSKILFSLTNNPLFWKRAFEVDIRRRPPFDHLWKSLNTDWKGEYIRNYCNLNKVYLPITTEDLQRGPVETLSSLAGRIFSSVGSFLSGGPSFKLNEMFYKPGLMLMCGLDAAGKTTILYKIGRGWGEVTTTIPTIGMNVETLEVGKNKFTVWDVGGPDKIRPLWRHYYSLQNSIIFVVDSNDRERIYEASEELNKILREDQLRELPVLVFANKQDLPNAMSVAEVTDKMGLHRLRNRRWFIQASCAPQGDGLHEGFEWLGQMVTAQRTGVDTSVIAKSYGPQF